MNAWHHRWNSLRRWCNDRQVQCKFTEIWKALGINADSIVIFEDRDTLAITWKTRDVRCIDILPYVRTPLLSHSKLESNAYGTSVRQKKLSTVYSHCIRELWMSEFKKTAPSRISTLVIEIFTPNYRKCAIRLKSSWRLERFSRLLQILQLESHCRNTSRWNQQRISRVAWRSNDILRFFYQKNIFDFLLVFRVDLKTKKWCTEARTEGVGRSIDRPREE